MLRARFLDASAALGALVISIPPLAVFAPHGIVVAVAVAAALCLLDPSVRRRLAVGRETSFGMVAVFGPLLLWMLLSCLWAPEPAQAVGTLVGRVTSLAMVVVLLGAASMPQEQARRVMIWYLAGAAVYLSLFGFELATSGWMTRQFGHYHSGGNDHLAHLYPAGSVLAVLAWPFVLAASVRFGRAGAVAMAVLVGATVAFSYSSTPKIGLAVSLGCAAVVAIGGRRGVALLAVAAAALLVVEPWGIENVLARFNDPDFTAFDWQYRHRMLIWQFAIERIHDHPWIGWGLASSRNIPGGHQLVPYMQGAELLPSHPHNFILHAWLELGAIGAAAMAWAVAGLLRVAGRRLPSMGGIAAVGTVGAYFGVHLVSHGLWQSWWQLSGGIAAVMVTVAMAARGGNA